MNSNELKSFQKRLGYRFRRRALLEAALTHPSFRHEVESGAEDNQRLEFLGDAVIGLLAAEHLYLAPGDLDEGAMTQLRSRITNQAGLAELGNDWNLGPLLRLGKGEARSGGADRESNIADAVEAVIGAVFRDGGMKACQKLFVRHVAARLEHMMSGEDDHPHLDNPKGFLQELTQRHWQAGPEYRIVEERGPAHCREYVAAVYWEEEELARGVAANKRAAEANAAARAVPEVQRRVALNSSSDGTSS